MLPSTCCSKEGVATNKYERSSIDSLVVAGSYTRRKRSPLYNASRELHLQHELFSPESPCDVSEVIQFVHFAFRSDEGSRVYKKKGWYSIGARDRPISILEKYQESGD